MTEIIPFPNVAPKAAADLNLEQAGQSMIQAYSFVQMLLAREFITEVTNTMETLTRDLNMILKQAGIGPANLEESAT